MPRAFIAYARPDKASVEKLVQDLRDLDVQVYWDDDLDSGKWNEQLRAEIRSADHFVWVMSTHSARSTEVSKEFGIASAAGAECHVLDLGGIDPRDTVHEVAGLQWTPAERWPRLASSLQDLDSFVAHTRAKSRRQVFTVAFLAAVAVPLGIWISVRTLLPRDSHGNEDDQARTAIEQPPRPLPRRWQEKRLILGSKDYLESHILLALMAETIEAQTDFEVQRAYNIKDNELWRLIRDGTLDVYADYSATLLGAMLDVDGSILRQPDRHEVRALNTILNKREESSFLDVVCEFGFSNSYVLVMHRQRANSLGIGLPEECPEGNYVGPPTISTLGKVAMEKNLCFGSHPDFYYRPDGLSGLAREYRLVFHEQGFLQHHEKYKALSEGNADVVDGYETDTELYFGDDEFLPLEDDKGSFPLYRAVVVADQRLLETYPDIKGALLELKDSIEGSEMAGLLRDTVNAGFVEMKLRSGEHTARKPLEDTVRAFLEEKGIL